MQHDLKCWPQPFDMTARGKKKAELRKADRPFADGDVLHLRRYDPEADAFTGDCLMVEVRGVYAGPFMPEGTVMLSHDEPMVWTGGCGSCRKQEANDDA